nr:MAG TPA: hypothetical protein [Caudoviricetes sp.]
MINERNGKNEGFLGKSVARTIRYTFLSLLPW